MNEPAAEPRRVAPQSPSPVVRVGKATDGRAPAQSGGVADAERVLPPVRVAAHRRTRGVH